MKLRDARLCLDCEDVHGDAICPGCGSESFAFLSRWVPAPEEPAHPRPPSSEQAEVYRALLAPPDLPARRRKLMQRGVLGLTAVGLAWAWRSRRPKADAQQTPPTADEDLAS